MCVVLVGWLYGVSCARDVPWCVCVESIFWIRGEEYASAIV